MSEQKFVRWKDIRANLDILSLVVTLILFSLGIVAIHSASSFATGTFVSSFALKQLIWGGVSAFVYILIIKLGYKKILSAAVPLFAVTTLLLILLLIVGHTSKGAQSWFNLGFVRFQPSELGKVVFALTLAGLCTKFPPVDFKSMLPTLALSGFIIFLILLQPDLGSALVYSVMLFAVLVAAGSPIKFLFGMGVASLMSLPILWFVLKPYQRMRLLVFVDPSIDPQGAGYNVIQSRIAVGSGGFFGKGFMQGTQGKLHFLPEPHTDFIFSVFSEEFGFVGSTIVLLLFALLLWKMLSTARYTKDMTAKLIVVAITAWIWFQITESVAMSMGLAPVTGLPLPLFSYGGSSLLAVVVGLALVQSVNIISHTERF